MMGLVLMWTTDSFCQPPSRPPPAGGRSRKLPPPLGGGAESSLLRWVEAQKAPSPSGGGPGWGACSMVKTMFKAKWTKLEPIPK